MSKKKRRSSKVVQGNPNAFDTHHLCFIRTEWGSGYAKAVRQFHYCRMKLPRDTIHRAIHEGMKRVPAPSNVAAKYAYEQLLLLDKAGVLHDDDALEKRLTLLIALFDCIEQPTADAFRKQLKIIQKLKEPP